MSASGGGKTNLYVVEISHPTDPKRAAYSAEGNDIIEALGLTFAEGEAFKAIWRGAASRKLGIEKKNYAGRLYDADKVHFYGGRMVAMAKLEVEPAPTENWSEEEEQRQAIVDQNGNTGEHYNMPTDKDGFRHWGGGGVAPVGYHDRVTVKFRDGIMESTIAHRLVWTHNGQDGDIVGYKPA